MPTAAPTAMMHDCSNDDSGLPLARLKVEQRWSSAAARQPWDVTLVTQLSPGRRAASPASPPLIRAPTRHVDMDMPLASSGFMF